MSFPLCVNKLVKIMLHVYECTKLRTLTWKEIDDVTGVNQILYDMPWMAFYDSVDQTTGIRVVLQGERDATHPMIVDYRLIEGRVVQIALFNLHLKHKVVCWIHDVHWRRNYEFVLMHNLMDREYLHKVAGWEEHIVTLFPDTVLGDATANQNTESSFFSGLSEMGSDIG